MINKTILTGRLTQKPVLKITGTTTMCQFVLAVNRMMKTQGQPDADFIRCVAFGKTAEVMEQYLSKGSLIGVEGRTQTGSYEDKETGKTIYTSTIIVERLQFLEATKKQAPTHTLPEETWMENDASDYPF